MTTPAEDAAREHAKANARYLLGKAIKRGDFGATKTPDGGFAIWAAEGWLAELIIEHAQALLAAHEAGRAEERAAVVAWQDISTASRDGHDRFLIAYRGLFDAQVTEAHWVGDGWLTHNGAGKLTPDNPDIIGWCPLPVPPDHIAKEQGQSQDRETP